MPTTVARDPICGMELDMESARFAYDDAGRAYLFCCTECAEIFVRTPRECVLHLEHGRSGQFGHACERQRNARQGDRIEVKGVLR